MTEYDRIWHPGVTKASRQEWLSCWVWAVLGNCGSEGGNDWKWGGCGMPFSGSCARWQFSDGRASVCFGLQLWEASGATVTRQGHSEEKGGSKYDSSPESIACVGPGSLKRVYNRKEGTGSCGPAMPIRIKSWQGGRRGRGE